MKTVLSFGLLVFSFFSFVNLRAQVSLPYYSGFDNATEQNGWTEYKTASTQFSHWSIASFNSYSAPNFVGHDYSPSTGITLTDNWYVSPGFLIPAGGSLDSVRYMFSGFSAPDTGDTIAIYLLNGSQNPALATSKLLLFDFRGADYVADNTYRLQTNIYLPPSAGTSYFAIRYRNTDCSSKWLTVAFDNIAISEGNVGINETEQEEDAVTVYPNPCNGKFTLNHSDKIESVTIQNEAGQIVFQSATSPGNNIYEIDLSDQPKGIYIVTILKENKVVNRKLVIE